MRVAIIFSFLVVLQSGCSKQIESPSRDASVSADANLTLDASVSLDASVADGSSFDAASEASVPLDATLPFDAAASLDAAVVSIAAPRSLVGAGGTHSCAILESGFVKCWGGNGSGQLGLGDTAFRGDSTGEMGDSLLAVELGAGRRAHSIACGNLFTCALLDDGDVKCWGGNGSGQLGLGDTASRGDAPGEMHDALPAVDLGDGNVISLAAGNAHACALFEDGRVKCWGYNNYGQLGLGDTTRRGASPGDMGASLPYVELGTGRYATAISAGATHTCAVLDDGSAKCWGYSGVGQLGVPGVTSRGDAPGEMGDALPSIDLGTARTALTIAAGVFHTCAVLDNASVKCWGFGSSGQLGLGDDEVRGTSASDMGDALPAVALGDLLVARTLALGAGHSCATFADGRLKCWGGNAAGQLGIGDALSRGTAPSDMGAALPFVSLGTAASISELVSGGNHLCARLSDGAIKCWGSNAEGQLGRGDTASCGDAAGEMGDALPFVEL